MIQKSSHETSGSLLARNCSPRKRKPPVRATGSMLNVAGCRWSRSTRNTLFEGPDGKVSLLDLFDGRRQLIIYHFMFDPSWDEGCRAARTWSTISRPSGSICMPTIPHWSSSPVHHWRSLSLQGAYELDHPVVLLVWQRLQLRFPCHDEEGENGGVSVFLREGEHIFHTYSTTGRGRRYPPGDVQLSRPDPAGTAGGLGRASREEYPFGRLASLPRHV